jgi:large subunit ribosomal protein L22
MEAQAVSRHLRIAPRTARLVTKTLKSVIANAEHAQRVDVDRLYVRRATVDGGSTLKRFLPRAHGRATPLRKRTSHVTIVVDERTRRA